MPQPVWPVLPMRGYVDVYDAAPVLPRPSSMLSRHSAAVEALVVDLILSAAVIVMNLVTSSPESSMTEANVSAALLTSQWVPSIRKTQSNTGACLEAHSIGIVGHEVLILSGLTSQGRALIGAVRCNGPRHVAF